MIILAYALAVAFLAFLAYFGIRSLARFLKKKPLFAPKGWIEDVIDGGVLVVLELLVALFIGLFFGGYSLWNALFFLAVIAAIVMVFRPSWIYSRWKENSLFKGENRHKTVLTLTLSLFVILELLAFNSRAYKTNSSATAYTFNDTSIVTNEGTVNSDGTSTFTSGQYFTFTGTDTTANKLYLNFTNTASLELTVKVDGYDSTGSWIGAKSHQVNPVVSENCLISIPTGAVKWKVTMTIDGGRVSMGDNINTIRTMTLKSFTLNAPIAFYFSEVRFIGCSLLAWLVIYFPSFMRHYEEKQKDLTRKTQLAILIGGCVVFLGFVIYALTHQELYFSSYPLKNDVRDYDIYTQMFDAFEHKQLNLRVSLQQTLWDHAYYNGLCYSYYGVLPVILVSFPFYWIFHVVPTSIFLESVGTILSVQVLLILICELYRVYLRKMNPASLYFALVVAFFCSLSMAFITYRRYFIGGDAYTWNPCVEANYHTPIAYGILNMDLFFLLVLYALESRKFRGLFLGLAGLAFGFIMASRPDLFLALIFVAPLLIKMLLDKQEKLSHRLLNFVPMVGTLLICAIAICWYNKSRFGSILDFGASHQYTVGDVSNLSIQANQIIPALFHYFLNPWGGTNNGGLFPFLAGTTPHITSDNSDYSNLFNSATGVLAVPVFWGLLLIPFSFKKKDQVILASSEASATSQTVPSTKAAAPKFDGNDPYLKATLILIPVTMMILAVVTYSLAGICPRYMYEIFNLAVLSSLLGIGMAFAKQTPEQRKISIPTVFVLSLVSIFICWNLSRDATDGLNLADLNGWLIHLREAFGSFNA